MGWGVESTARRLPLRWLLAGVLLLVLFLSLLGFSGLIYLRVSQFLWANGQRQIVAHVSEGLRNTQGGREGRRFFRNSSRLTAEEDLPAQASSLVQALRQPGFVAVVVGADGKVLARSRGRNRAGEEPEIVLPLDLWENCQRSLAEKSNYSFLHKFYQDWQMVTFPLLRGEELVGILLVGQRWQDSQATLKALRQDLALVSLLVLALAGALSIALGSLLSRPLEHLARVTVRVREGDLTARTGGGPGRNEVYQVSRDFDAMVERLQQAFEAQRRFVADASHELKTPLTAISGMVEVLQMGADGGDPQQRARALAAMGRECDRMTRLVADLLTLSRSQQAPPLELKPLEMADVVAEVVTQLHPLFPQHRLQVEGRGAVMAEPDALLRVVRNLVENALKYSPSTSQVEIAILEDSTSSTWLEVRDEGPGIAPEDLAHVFDRFYRADPSRSRATGGSGLGLPIARALLEQMGGDLKLHSELGRGTLARVCLPRPASGNLQKTSA